MTTESEARRSRLGESACARAREVAADAPVLKPDQLNALAVLLRDTSTTKATSKAA